MANKVLILGKIHDGGVDMLRKAGGLEIKEMAEHVPEIFDELPDTDAIIVRMTKITREVCAAAPDLKIVARHGVGYEAVDVDALTDHGVPLTITGDVNSTAVAEHTLALMLALAKQVVTYDRATRNDNFAIRDGFDSTELSGKTALLAGFGRSGRATAMRAAAFGMKVMIADPFVSAEQVEGEGYGFAPDFRAALPEADYVCIHVPKTPETTNLISTDELKAMKTSAHLLNVSRGGIVDEAALYTALTEGWIRGAALDVFEPEPPQSDNPLLALDNIVVSPHCGAFTEECAQRMAEACARSVLDALEGNYDPELVINKEALPE
ncbi:MAG TPA: 3-phosphoglycerate dehydrogenase [Rhodospirillaceae bacterium]|nr:3-phosphoglycerate dehydrogenase [Rhodospirillaceae bacterium]